MTEARSLLEQALGLARLGVMVYPALPSKAPACRNGFKDASCDEAIVRWLIERAPSADRIGMPTGAVTGIAVIDVDPAGFKWLDGNLHRLPPTRTHSTPRGGRHLFFRHPPGLRCSTGKLSAGIDIRADGGCIIIAGPGYAVVDRSPIADFPEFVLGSLAWLDRLAAQRLAEIVRRYRRSGRGEVSETRLADFVRRLPRGERNTGLHWAACRAGDGGSSGAALVAAAIATGLSSREAQKTVDSGLDRGRQS